MSGPDVLGLSDLYEEISDTELADLDLDENSAIDVDNVPDAPTYAAAAARGTRDDWSASDPGDYGTARTARPERAARRDAPQQNVSQFRLLSDFERDNFHPLNVTPDRPCTAYFKAPEQVTAKQLFDSFREIGIAANAVRCLQRRGTGEFVVTFSNADQRAHFLQHSPLIERRRYATHPEDSAPLLYLTVFDAPHELPDSAIEHRLRPYCTVYSRRRGRIQGYPDTCNGLRHFRISLHDRCVPCYLRFGKYQLRFYHDGQIKTCRKCGSSHHLARDCTNQVCFNCDERGHTAKDCESPMLCCICKSRDHKAIDCRFSWYRRPTRVQVDDGDSATDAPSAERPRRCPEPPQTVEVGNTAEDNAGADPPPSTRNELAGSAGTETSDPQLCESLDSAPPTEVHHTDHEIEDLHTDHDADDHILSSQGFIVAPSTADLAMPERPPVVAPSTPDAVLRDLEMSEEDAGGDDDTFDDDALDDEEESSAPSSSAARQEARPLASAVKRPKRLQRKPAKILALSSAPTRKPTMPTVIASRRKQASQTAPALARDNSKDNSKEDPPADHAPT